MAGLLGDVLPYIYSRGNALRRGLLDTIQNPVASMEQTAGLLQDKHREQQNVLAQAFADPRDPFKVTDKRAMNQAATNMLMGPLGFAPAGITAWHGTPHKFDKFDSSKIGTGEGAQAYGHGLYLAESPAVAGTYKNVGTDASYSRVTGGMSPMQEYAHDLFALGKNEDDVFSAMHRKFGQFLKTDAEMDAFDQAIKSASAAQGNLYKVDLPDDAIAKMLDWDKPLSQQHEAVRTAAMDLGLPKTATGKDIYNALAQQARDMAITRGNNAATTLGASQAGASADLRGFGIPGIRYLDGGSRANGGTSNFVVFPGEENMLKILERNGQPVRAVDI
jgi:hypothetical protein